MKIKPHYKTYLIAFSLGSACASVRVLCGIGGIVIFVSSFIAIAPTHSGKCDSLCRTKELGAISISLAVSMIFSQPAFQAGRRLEYDADCYYSMARSEFETSKSI